MEEADRLEARAFSSTVDCLRKLSALAEYANETFRTISNETTKISTRLNCLSDRTYALQNIWPTLKPGEGGKIASRDLLGLMQTPQSQHLMDRKTMPVAMKRRYESKAVNGLLLFQTLDSQKHYLLHGNKVEKIAHRYSDPNFFLKQWCTVQEARMKQVEKDRKQHKVDKKLRKMQQDLTNDSAQLDASLDARKKKNSINWQERCVIV